MWIDRLMTEFEGEPVQLDRAIAGPGYEEMLTLTFADGSTLAIDYNANLDPAPLRGRGEGEYMDAGAEARAHAVWARWIEALYEKATSGTVDADLGPRDVNDIRRGRLYEVTER